MSPNPIDLDAEVWRPIPGYEGLYEVSNIGRVKSLERTITMKTGQRQHWPERIKKHHLNNIGYYSVMLSHKGKQKLHQVHRLVAMAFLGVEPNLQVNHKDCNKLNNNLLNLEWVTLADNIRHAFANGLISRQGRKGEVHPFSKLTEEQVLQIINLNGTHVDIARQYGVSRSTIADIKNKKRWRHLHADALAPFKGGRDGT